MEIKSKLLLEPKDFKPSFRDWELRGVLNPAAIRLADKKIMLYVRIAENAGAQHGNMIKCPIILGEEKYKVEYEDIEKTEIIRLGRWGEMYLKDGVCRLPTISHFKKVILDESGFNVVEKYDKPVFTGMPGDGEYGVEDPRILKIGNRYLMTYVSISTNEGVSTSLAISKDLKSWKREGIIFREQNKDVVIFPEKIKGKYVALHRPEGFFGFSRPSIWISYSWDLIYWGREKSILRPRGNSWEHERTGAGAPPIKTKKGWLLIYHGVENLGTGRIYSGGAALLDLKNPEKVIARSPAEKALIEPTQAYETKGFIDNVVFPTGAVMDLNKEDLLIYCGGADSVISVKKINIDDILKSMEYY